MRRREQPASIAASPRAKAGIPEGAYDWTTTDGPSSGAHAPQAPQSAAIPAATVMAMQVRGDAGSATAASAGDELTVTIGKSSLFPVRYNGLEVGPLSMSVRLRQGETPAEAYGRARAVLEELYQAELDLRLKEFVDHLDEARKRVRGE
jgi:hypothetical protein